METKSTKEQLAEKLNGIDYSRDIPEEYYPVLVENNLVVVLGGSDDLCYFLFPENGKVEKEELGCWEGDTFWFDKDFKKITDSKNGILTDWRADKQVNCCNSIAAVWCDKDVKAPNGDYYSWTYKTQIPHVTFDITETYRGEISYYCKAIIFSINDLK
jgi:hypothetical protein